MPGFVNQPEAFNKLIDNLPGLTKVVAKKVLSGSFAMEMNKLTGTDAKGALKKLVDAATKKATDAIRLKIAMIFIVIVGLLALLAVALTHSAGGSIAIPIVILVILIATIWFITGVISNLVARKASNAIFKAIEGKIGA